MGHSRQFVRVALAPPNVYEPGGHDTQASASFPLYKRSSPQAEQASARAADHFPARHGAQENALPPE